MPIGSNSHVPVKLESSLDYDLELSLGKYGPFTPFEMILIFLITFGLSGMLILLGFLIFGMWGALAMSPTIFPIGWIMLILGVKIKKKVGHSWMWDLRHRLGFVFSGKRHWSRPKHKRTYTGKRKVVANKFTETKSGGLIPTNEAELVYGVPEIKEYDPKTETFKESITPKPVLNETYLIHEHVYQHHAQRTPHYFKNAVVPKDDEGYPAICNWTSLLVQVDTETSKNNE